MDYNSVMQRHLGNISRQVGNDVSNRYNYIVSNDDLTNAYLQMRDELGYPLMVDSKNRRAIVYNKKGLEKKIQELINQSILSNIQLLERMIVEDVVSSITMSINGIGKGSNGGTLVKNNSATSMFASALAKGLVLSVGKLIDEITNPKERKKK